MFEFRFECEGELAQYALMVGGWLYEQGNGGLTKTEIRGTKYPQRNSFCEKRIPDIHGPWFHG